MTAVFPWLNPEALFGDTLSSAEGSEEARLPGDRGEECAQEEPEGDVSNLMQKSGKRKRGSPKPTARAAGSTATFSWRTLQPPRKMLRARGRGRGSASSGGRPVIPSPSNLEVCAEEDTDEDEPAADEEEETAEQVAPATTLPDDEEITRREECYQQLHRVMGIGSATDGEDSALAFSSHSLDDIQNHWDPLTAGELLARGRGGVHGGTQGKGTSAHTREKR